MSPADLRPATLADAPAITELLNEVDRIEIGRPETDRHAVEPPTRRAPRGCTAATA